MAVAARVLLFFLLIAASCGSQTTDRSLDRDESLLRGGTEAESYFLERSIWIDEYVERCMREKGFVYSAPTSTVATTSTVAPQVGWGFAEGLIRETAADGYRPDELADAEARGVETPEAAAYSAALQGSGGADGCSERAIRGWDETGRAREVLELERSLLDAVELWRATPSVVRSFDAWRECMATAGFRVTEPSMLGDQILERFFGDPTDHEGLYELEERLFEANQTCPQPAEFDVREWLEDAA